MVQPIYPIPITPMPQLRPTLAVLEDLATAVDRGLKCWSTNQMADALISMEYFLKAAQTAHENSLTSSKTDE